MLSETLTIISDVCAKDVMLSGKRGLFLKCRNILGGGREKL